MEAIQQFHAFLLACRSMQQWWCMVPESGQMTPAGSPNLLVRLQIDAAVITHGSRMEPSQVEAIRQPTAFLWAESDDPELLKKVREVSCHHHSWEGR